MSDDPLSSLETALGHRFASRELLERALSHRSWANETGAPRNSERLEFLGDAVLDLVAGEWLFRRSPDPEGELSRLKSFLVSEPVVAGLARGLELGRHLRLGVGEERSGGREKASLLADAFEAVLGALYLDAGLAAAQRLLEPLLADALAAYDEVAESQDAKTALQEALQGQGLAPPEYRLVGESGPDHQKIFTVECRSEGRRLGRGEGTSKKRAEQAAATMALESL